jgi:cobalt-zinc-cadmium efflux system outer membrane protein
VLQAHPAGAEADALEAVAEGRQQAARLLEDPTFSAGWDRGHLRSPGSPGFDEWSFAVTQTLPWPGTWSARSEAGEHAAEALRAEATLARWKLAVAARLAYARLRFARTALEVGRAAEEDARSLRDLVRTRAELGEGREVDRLKADLELLREQRRARRAAREASVAEEHLRRLAVSALPEPLVLAPSPPLPDRLPDESEIRARLLEVNPTLRAARAAARRDEALASVTRRERIPDLDVTVFHDRELEKTATGVALGVRVPLWNANRGEIAVAESRAAGARRRYERTRLRTLDELTAAVGELEIARAEAALLKDEMLPAARRSLDLARLSFEEGETSLLDLLDTQRVTRETTREAATGRLALAEALGRVQLLVGPGFEIGSER